jgi:hypothetical protein
MPAGKVQRKISVQNFAARGISWPLALEPTNARKHCYTSEFEALPFNPALIFDPA